MRKGQRVEKQQQKHSERICDEERSDVYLHNKIDFSIKRLKLFVVCSTMYACKIPCRNLFRALLYEAWEFH